MSNLFAPHYQQMLVANITNEQNNLSANSVSEASDVNDALFIYRNNYIETGIRALSISFPTVLALLGEDAFRNIAKLYLIKHPKDCFDWADYGAMFSAYLFDIDALADTPYIPEVAELDWRLSTIERQQDIDFDADSFALLQNYDAAKLNFVPAPGLQVMNVYFPVQELYSLVHNASPEGNEHTKAEGIENLKILIHSAINNPVLRSIVLWREHYKALFEYCEQMPAKAFESMVNESSVEQVLASFGDDQAAMSQWLQQHIGTRKIYAITTRNRTT